MLMLGAFIAGRGCSFTHGALLRIGANFYAETPFASR